MDSKMVGFYLKHYLFLAWICVLAPNGFFYISIEAACFVEYHYIAVINEQLKYFPKEHIKHNHSFCFVNDVKHMNEADKHQVLKVGSLYLIAFIFTFPHRAAEINRTQRDV